MKKALLAVLIVTVIVASFTPTFGMVPMSDAYPYSSVDAVEAMWDRCDNVAAVTTTVAFIPPYPPTGSSDIYGHWGPEYQFDDPGIYIGPNYPGIPTPIVPDSASTIIGMNYPGFPSPLSPFWKTEIEELTADDEPVLLTPWTRPRQYWP